MSNINLSKLKLHTDLIIESNQGKSHEKIINGVTVTSTDKDGHYITISFDDITNYENRELVGKILETELKKILSLNNIKETDECLIIGLGNEQSTPDSLGVKVLHEVLITKHLFIYGNPEPGIRVVTGFTPGVMANTGMETSDIINAIIAKEKPKFVIIIDALAALAIERINKTIQLTDTGIHPGSGIGNNRKEISFHTEGIPVIAIGVPTVVSSSTIVYDTLNYLSKHISYLKNHQDTSKLTVKHSDYKNKIKNNHLSVKETNELFGLFGELTPKDQISLINEVLNEIELDLIVTPSEIDFLIDKLSNLISSSINNALHRQITHY